MTTEQLLDELARKIYQPPLSGFRESEEIRDVENPISVVILIIDFDTEWQMNGIFNFLGNSTGRYLKETIKALDKINAVKCLNTLNEIAVIAQEAKMTHEAIQEDRSSLTEYQILSWNEAHGNKWEEAENKINRLDETFDFDELYQCLEAFVAKHNHFLKEKIGS